MSGTIQRVAETAATERYEALLRASQTLISIRSSDELFSILAQELRAVANFCYLGVAIYDEQGLRAAGFSGPYERHLKIFGESGAAVGAPKAVPEESLTWWVYQHQQPLVISSLDAETRFPLTVGFLKDLGVRSVCALPLTTVHRRSVRPSS